MADLTHASHVVPARKGRPPSTSHANPTLDLGDALDAALAQLAKGFSDADADADAGLPRRGR